GPVPLVLSVAERVLVPATRAVLAGSTALLSDEVKPTVLVTVFTRFQFASTALTVTLKAVPAVWAVGAPVLPVALPGEAVSPGARTCSLGYAPALTVIDGLGFAVMGRWGASGAVTVFEPTVLRVTLNVCAPLRRAVLAGRPAFTSLEVMAIVSLVLTTFQLASTALTVTLKAVPAVWAEGVPVLPVLVPAAAVSP